MIEPERLCLFCSHFDLEMGEKRYSSYTPGRAFSMDCKKKHWNFSHDDSEEHYRQCIIAAWKCPDYELVPGLIAEIAAAKP